VALVHFLAASLFCKDARRSSSSDSRENNHFSRRCVGKELDSCAQCWDFTLNGEYGFDVMD
jgi:hypothetical protein